VFTLKEIQALTGSVILKKSRWKETPHSRNMATTTEWEKEVFLLSKLSGRKWTI